MELGFELVRVNTYDTNMPASDALIPSSRVERILSLFMRYPYFRRQVVRYDEIIVLLIYWSQFVRYA